MKPFELSPCDVYTLWTNADQLIRETPKGYILDGELKHPFWAIASDPLGGVPLALKEYQTQMALVKFLDGSPVAVRYRTNQFVIANMCPKCHRDLDFIVRVLGPEGLVLHQKAHERDEIIKKLETIRDDTIDRATRESLFDLIKDMKK
jgi:hypothetical protein